MKQHRFALAVTWAIVSAFYFILHGFLFLPRNDSAAGFFFIIFSGLFFAFLIGAAYDAIGLVLQRGVELYHDMMNPDEPAFFYDDDIRCMNAVAWPIMAPITLGIATFQALSRGICQMSREAFEALTGHWDYPQKQREAETARSTRTRSRKVRTSA